MKKIFLLLVTGCTVLTASAQPSQRHFLLRDEGISQLAYIDEAHPDKNWYVPVPTGRDMQLVGNGRVLIGTGNGYEEHDITTGKKVKELTGFPGTVAARRLRNGNTLLTGVNWQQQKGIVLIELKDSIVQRTIVYPGFNYVRLVRETPDGHFLVTADDVVFEGDASGQIVWQSKIVNKEKPHAWQASRIAGGRTIVSSGYAANFQVFGPNGAFIRTIEAPASVKPNFFAGFQVLPNGHLLLANWQGHGANLGASGTQIVEIDEQGQLAWSWQQDATKFSSLQAVILLDGVDVRKVQIE